MITKNAQALIDMSDEEFLVFVSRDTSEMSKIVYNRAIEIAANAVHTSKGYPTPYSDTIRKLKK